MRAPFPINRLLSRNVERAEAGGRCHRRPLRRVVCFGGRPLRGGAGEAGTRLRYAGMTVGDRNPVKRYLQRRRLRDAVGVLAGLDGDFSGEVLDFGGGSGELSKMLAARFPGARVLCYEPMPGIFEEAARNLAGLGNVTLVSDRGDLEGLRFGCVFCLEVFEHLPPRQTARTIKTLNRLLGRDGVFVVGVPNEIFLPALVKGLFRMTRHYGAHDARPINILRAVIGRPPKGPCAGSPAACPTISTTSASTTAG